MAESTLAELEIEVGDIGTHNVIPLLHEIRHALAQLLEEGKETAIDLRSIPLAPGQRQLPRTFRRSCRRGCNE